MATAVLPPVAAHRLFRFTVASYDEMLRDGVLSAVDDVELLDGWIVRKMSRNAPHDSSVYRLQCRLLRLLPDGYLLRIQSAIDLPTSVPEPDLAVVLGPESRYDERRPQVTDVVLVVEVADSSLSYDRGSKRSIYAAAKIPQYWIVNLEDRRLECCSLPRGGRKPGYRRVEIHHPGDTAAVVVNDVALGFLAVAELFPVI